MRQTQTKNRAFSLVELVMVVTIMGMIAAIAVPRITQAAASAKVNAAQATVANVRKCIDMYFAEHGHFPAQDAGSGTGDESDFVAQLTRYSDEHGKTSEKYDPPRYIYGPYLRAPFPTNPFNGLNTVNLRKSHGDAPADEGTVGWEAVMEDGSFGLSMKEDDFEKIEVLDLGSFRGVAVRADDGR